MKNRCRFIVALALSGLAGCATGGNVTGLEDDISTGRSSSQADRDLPVQVADFRGSQINSFAKRMSALEAYYRRCPPGTESCQMVRAVGGQPALRGSAPWMAQITLPERWVSDETGPVAAGDWQQRHICGGALVAPGWVVTAAHCVDEGMIAERWRVRVGMSNLALDDGRYYTIDRIVCFAPANCRYPRRDPLYRDDIALVQFTPAPGDLVRARDLSAFENIGVEAVEVSEREAQLSTWSEDGTRRRWDIATGAELDRAERAPGDVLPSPRQSHPNFDLNAAWEQASRVFEMPIPGRGMRLSWPAPEDAQDNSGTTLLRVESSDPSQPSAQTLLEAIRISQSRVAPDESYFMIVTGDDCPCDVSARDTATLRELWSLSLSPPLSVYDFRDGRTSPEVLEISEYGMLVSNADEVLVVDPASGAIRKRFSHPRSQSWQNQNGGPPDEGARNLVAYASFSEDGRHILTATNRYGESDVWLWDVATGAVEQRFEHEDAPLSEVLLGAKLVQGGRRVLSWTGYGTYRLWDAATGAQLSIMRQQLPMQQGHLLRGDTIGAIVDSAGMSNWTLETGAQISRFDHLRNLEGALISPDETRELTWSRDGTARLWNIDSGTEALRIYHNGRVNGAAFMDDPQHIASWSDDGTARITNSADRSISMAFDVGQYPPGSALALPVTLRPAQAAEVSYLALATPGGPPPPDSEVSIFGWGKTQQPGGFDPYASLMTVDLTVLANETCADLPGMGGNFRVHPGIFCARDEVQKTCKGDSGGPVVQDGVLVGVVSWGKRECTYDGEPGVYTRIAAYSDWITQQIDAAAASTGN